MILAMAAVTAAFGLLFYVMYSRAIDYRNLMLFAVVFTLPLRSSELLKIGGANVRMGDLFLVAAFAVFLLEWLIDRRGLPEFNWVHVCLIAFVGWGLVTIVWSLDRPFGVVRAGKYARNLALFLLVAHWTYGRFSSAFRTIGAGVVGSFAYIVPVVMQRAVAVGFTPAMLVHPDNVTYVLGRLRGPQGISGGTFAEGGTILALASWTLVAIFFWLGLGWWRSPRIRARLTFWFVLIVLTGVLFLTFSRGAWGALAIGGVWWFIRLGRTLPRRTRIAAILLVLLGGAAALRLGLYEIIATRILSVAAVKSPDEDISISLRFIFWTISRDTLLVRPFGVGLGGTTVAVGQKSDTGIWFVHNLYLQLLMELGPPGLVLVLASFGICLLRLARAAKRPLERGLRPAAVALIGAFIAYLIMSVIDFDLTEMEIWVLMGVASCIPVRWAVVVPARRQSAPGEQPALAGS